MFEACVPCWMRVRQHAGQQVTPTAREVKFSEAMSSSP